MNNMLNHTQRRFFRSELERERVRYTDHDARREPYTLAIARLDDGSYGTCLDCGAVIPIDRLLAIPETPYCVTCGSRRAA